MCIGLGINNSYTKLRQLSNKLTIAYSAFYIFASMTLWNVSIITNIESK